MSKVNSVTQQHNVMFALFQSYIEKYVYTPFDEDIKEWHVAEVNYVKGKSVLDKSKKVFHKFMKGKLNLSKFIEEIYLWIAPTASISERKISFMKGVLLEVLRIVKLCISYNNGPCYKFQYKYCTFLHFTIPENTQDLPILFQFFEVLYKNV